MTPARSPAAPIEGKLPMNASLSVMKFGGSSFATEEKILTVCEYIRQRLAQNGPEHRILCVVSAPSGLTEQYRATLLSLNPTPSDRLIDAGLPLADSLGAVLVAAALQAMHVTAGIAFGNQIGLRTDRNYTRAQLVQTVVEPLRDALASHQVVVVPGGQAAAVDTGETTWMGKNSSDLSAIALAVAFGLDAVEIYSDVPGVYSCDPNMVPEAYPIASLSHRQAVEMSMAGAKVLHHRGVQFAMEHAIRIVCRGNSGDFSIGTVLSGEDAMAAAVIPDARSQVFGGDARQIAIAVDALSSASVPLVQVQAADGTTRLCITCGFFDARHFLAQRNITLEAQELRLLSVITPDGSILRQLVAPAELTTRAAVLHRRHCGAAAKQTPAVSAAAAAAVPLAQRLAALATTGATSHV